MLIYSSSVQFFKIFFKSSGHPSLPRVGGIMDKKKMEAHREVVVAFHSNAVNHGKDSNVVDIEC